MESGLKIRGGVDSYHLVVERVRMEGLEAAVSAFYERFGCI